MRNPHLQTIVPSQLRSLPKTPIHRETFTLPDGDFIDVDYTDNASGPVLILLHGLEGSTESQYIQAMLNQAHRAGWQGVGMHFRGCSGRDNSLPRSYHSGDIEDFHELLLALHVKYPHRKFAAAGYSLGGSVILNWLATHNESKLLDAACAVSVPYELATCASRMNQGFSRVYRNHFMKTLRDKVRRKAPLLAQHKVDIDLRAIEDSNDFWVFDHHVTAKLHGFRDAEDYYRSCSSKPKLKSINIPTLLIHSLDDPFMHPHCVPQPEDLSDAVELELTQHGGHLGFVSGSIPLRPRYDWLETRMMHFLKEKLEGE